MDDDDEQIKQDIDAPLKGDDQAAARPVDTDDDLVDDFGRGDLPGKEVSTHPSMDTDVDPTELYHEGLAGPADVDENDELVEEEETDEEDTQDNI